MVTKDAVTVMEPETFCHISWQLGQRGSDQNTHKETEPILGKDKGPS